MPLYEKENLTTELDSAYRRIEKQKEDLKNVLGINEKLSKVLIQGGGLSLIVKILGKSLNTVVVLEDKHFNVMESLGDYTEHEMMKFIQVSKGKESPFNSKVDGRKENC